VRGLLAPCPKNQLSVDLLLTADKEFLESDSQIEKVSFPEDSK
jgi:hypothetical protein